MVNPRAIILGFPKCGTTALATYFTLYPEIQVHIKEPNYFNDTNFGDPAYQSFFDHRYFGIDKSPTLVYGVSNLHRLKQTVPDIQIVICVRNPSERFFSEYYFMSSKMVLPSYKTALTQDCGFVYDLFDKGRYIKWLTPLYKLFSAEQITIIKQEDIKENPNKTINEFTAKFGLSQIHLWHKVVNRSPAYKIDEEFQHQMDRRYYSANLRLLELTGINYLA